MKFLFQRQGFSFLELLVVVAILGILATKPSPVIEAPLNELDKKKAWPS